MSTPLVSVVMPSYNHARFVRQSMESVLSQRDVDLEFLIEDDGSSDGTREVIAQVNDPRIRFVPRERNLGAAVTHNALVSRARGEFVALINSDDVWSTPDKLASQLEVLQARPELAACFGRAAYIDEQGEPRAKDQVFAGRIFDQPNRPRAEWLRRFFLGGNCLCHPTVLMRRSCYQALGPYDDRLRQIPDYEMWLRVVKRWDIHVIERELVNFRIVGTDNASSITPANIHRLRNEEFFVIQDFFEGVDRATLLAGFADLLINPDPRTADEVEVEKALLFFKTSEPTYWTTGLRKVFDLLGQERFRAILSDYGIGPAWLQERMGAYTAFQYQMPSEPPQVSATPQPPAAPPPAAGKPGPGLPLLRYLGFLRR